MVIGESDRLIIEASNITILPGATVTALGSITWRGGGTFTILGNLKSTGYLVSSIVEEIVVSGNGVFSIDQQQTYPLGWQQIRIEDNGRIIIKNENSALPYMDLSNQSREYVISLEKAENLVLDAQNLSSADTADSVSLRFATYDYIQSPDTRCFLRVGDKSLSLSSLDDMSLWDDALSGIRVLGFEQGWEKSFSYENHTHTVWLNMSKIPEPSTFGFITMVFAITLSLRRRERGQRQTSPVK